MICYTFSLYFALLLLLSYMKAYIRPPLLFFIFFLLPFFFCNFVFISWQSLSPTFVIVSLTPCIEFAKTLAVSIRCAARNFIPKHASSAAAIQQQKIQTQKNPQQEKRFRAVKNGIMHISAIANASQCKRDVVAHSGRFFFPL